MQPAKSVLFNASDYIFRLVERGWNCALNDGQFADRAIEQIFREERLSDKAIRKLVVETLYEMLRNARLLKSAADSDKFGDIYDVWRVMRLIPEKNLNSKESDFAEKLRVSSTVRAARLSVPDWLDEMGDKECGENWERIAASMLQKPKIVLRANLRNCAREELIKETSRLGYEPKPLLNNNCGVIVNSGEGLFSTKLFMNGWYETQDASSQEVGLFCDIKPGMRAIDSCAGAGGKSLHLADLMNNKGKIIALDIRENALAQLRSRASRAKVDIIETRHINATKIIKRLSESAQIVLIDAPCSGSGVFRRNPDAKWRISPENILELRNKQADILSQHSSMVAARGFLIYSVCSIFPSEGEEQIKQFLYKMDGRFRLAAERRICPSENGFDGFYMAKMERVN